MTKTLGHGFSAKVKLAHTSDGKDYALKIFDLTKENNDTNFIKMLKEEINATMGLKHKHIIRYHEFQENVEMTKGDGSKVPVAFIA